MSINCYRDAADYLGSKSDRPLSGRSTRLVRNADDSISVKYHDTNVITYTRGESSRIILTSGGFKTSTTKARINEYTQYRLSQSKGIWTIAIGSKSYPFFEGMSIDPIALTVDNLPDSDLASELTLRKSINDYVKGYMAALYAGTVPQPSAADCWACKGLFGTADNEHLKLHIEEGYCVPQLIVNAIKDFPVSRAARYSLSNIWGNTGTIDSWEDIARKQLTKSLRSYLYRSFGLVS